MDGSHFLCFYRLFMKFISLSSFLPSFLPASSFLSSDVLSLSQCAIQAVPLFLFYTPLPDDSANRPLSSDEWLARIGSLKIQGLTYDQLVQRLAFKHSDGVLKKKHCDHNQVRVRRCCCYSSGCCRIKIWL